MKIVKNSLVTVTFDSLKPGDVFRCDNDYIWIKIKREDAGCNAIDLEDGEFGRFENNESITPLPNAKVVID